MKKIFTLLLVACTLTGFSQTGYKAEISSRIKEHSAKVMQKDVDGMLDFMYPKFFDLFPRDTIKNSIKGMFTDSTLTITFDSIRVDSIGKIIIDGNVQYTLLVYNMKMKMRLNGYENSTEGERKQMFDLLENTYKQMYTDVVLDYPNRTFIMKPTNYMIAIKDPAYSDKWYFIEKKDELKNYIVGTLIPQKVWDAMSK